MPKSAEFGHRLVNAICSARGKLDDLTHKPPVKTKFFGSDLEVYKGGGSELSGIKTRIGNTTSGIIGPEGTVLHLHDTRNRLVTRVELGKAHPTEQLSGEEIQEILGSMDIAKSPDGKMINKGNPEQEIVIVNFRIQKNTLTAETI